MKYIAGLDDVPSFLPSFNKAVDPLLSKEATWIVPSGLPSEFASKSDSVKSWNDFLLLAVPIVKAPIKVPVVRTPVIILKLLNGSFRSWFVAISEIKIVPTPWASALYKFTGRPGKNGVPDKTSPSTKILYLGCPEKDKILNESWKSFLVWNVGILLSLKIPKFIFWAFLYQVPCLLSNLSASNPVSGPSFSDVQTLPQLPKSSTVLPEPLTHMLLLSVNASCLTPPKVVSNPEPPFLIVNVTCLEPPSDNPSAVLFLVSAITPAENPLGDGFDVGFDVFASNLKVLPDWPEILIL